MDKIDIEKILLERGYKPQQANSVSASLLKIDGSLKPLLNEWLTSANELDYEVEGFKISSLMQKYKLFYPAALLTLDWLLRDPENAKSAIKRGIR